MPGEIARGAISIGARFVVCTGSSNGSIIIRHRAGSGDPGAGEASHDPGAGDCFSGYGVRGCGVFAAFKLRKPPEPVFHQLVFGRGFIETARFTPDGQNVVYGASWSGKPFEIFTTGLDGLESRSLDLPPANILGIGANGQMAISLGMHHTMNWMTTGTLAEVSLTGGAPRPLLDSVCDGDMSPDGKRAALVRCSGAVETLEFPSGTVLFRTSGYISHVRMSRDGGEIVFAEHPVLGDDRGFVTLVDLQGKSKRLTAEWSSVRGIAWGPSGKEVWFTASENAEPQKLMAVDRKGKVRNILQSPAYLWLQSISAAGKVLLGDTQEGGGISFHAASASDRPSCGACLQREHDEADGISSDGSRAFGDLQRRELGRRLHGVLRQKRRLGYQSASGTVRE